MLLPLTYADNKKDVLNELSEIAEKVHNRPHKWKKYQPYSIEYTWVIDQVEKYIGNVNEKNIIDAGGGVGMVQYYLARRGANILNVSRAANPKNESNIKKYVKGIPRLDGTFGPKLCNIANDLAIVKLEENYYDGITCISSIEHNPWEHIIKCVKNLVKSLKVGCPIIISIPLGKKRRWYRERELSRLPMCVYLFDPSAVIDLVNELGNVELVTNLEKDYEKLWVNTHNKMIKTPGTIKYPLLSGGFVLIKRR